MRSTRRPQKKPDKLASLLRWLDAAFKSVSILAIVFGGAWALYKFVGAGGDDWMINMDMEVQVSAYTDKLAIVAVTLKTTNPRDREIEFTKDDAGEFIMEARRMPATLKSGDPISFQSGELIQRADLAAENDYVMIPHGEIRSALAFVIDSDAVLTIHAEVGQGDDTVTLDRVINVAAELRKK